MAIATYTMILLSFSGARFWVEAHFTTLFKDICVNSFVEKCLPRLPTCWSTAFVSIYIYSFLNTFGLVGVSVVVVGTVLTRRRRLDSSCATCPESWRLSRRKTAVGPSAQHSARWTRLRHTSRRGERKWRPSSTCRAAATREKEERHFICHTTAEPSSGWRESTDSSSPFSSPPPPPQKGKTKISPQKKKKKRTSDGILLLYFDKVKIPRWGVSSSTPMPAQSVHIYTRKLTSSSSLNQISFLLLLVILFVPWSLTGAAIFNDEWTERRKWENQPAAQLCASTIGTHTQTRIHTERAIIAYQHARYIPNKQTWLHIVYNLN